MTDSVLIVAHGSDKTEWGDAARQCAEALTEMLAQEVHYAYKGDDEPTIPSVLEEIAGERPDRLVVVPLFFAPGMFSERVIPPKFGIPPGGREGSMDIGGRPVRTVVTEAFGTDPLMEGILSEVLARHPPEDTSVLLVSHGSKDRANRDTVEMNAERVRKLGYPAHVCFNEMEEPDVPEGLEDAAGDGRGTVVVIPMFVSPGNHTVRDIPGKLGLRDGEREAVREVGGRSVRVVYEREIGLSPGVARIVLGQLRSLR